MFLFKDSVKQENLNQISFNEDYFYFFNLIHYIDNVRYFFSHFLLASSFIQLATHFAPPSVLIVICKAKSCNGLPVPFAPEMMLRLPCTSSHPLVKLLTSEGQLLCPGSLLADGTGG